jgi:hypothetical protein
MKIQIELECDNAAFEGKNLVPQIAWILGTAAGKIDMQLRRKSFIVCSALEADDKLLDTNGNTVGFVRIINP